MNSVARKCTSSFVDCPTSSTTQGELSSLYDKPGCNSNSHSERHHQGDEVETKLALEDYSEESKSLTTVELFDQEKNEDFSSGDETLKDGDLTCVADEEVTANTNGPPALNTSKAPPSPSLGNLQAVPCSDENTNSFAESDVIRFRNNFFEVIEELRIRRTLDSENEERINTLVTEKHELERKQEEEVSRCNLLLEQRTEKESNIKKQYEERLQKFEEEKAKLTMTSECNEKETKVLKDEVRALHLTKYHLERTIKDQERQMQLQTSARESYEFQLTELEQQCKEAFKQCSEVSGLVDKVDANSSRLHKKLMYANEHHSCLINSYKTELELTRKELVNVKASMAKQLDSVTSDEHSKANRYDTVEKELRMQVEVSRQLKSQLFDSRQENKAFLNSLKEAHQLLGKHVESINKHAETEAALQQDLDKEKTARQETETLLQAEKDVSQGLQEELRQKEQQWNEEKEHLDEKLTALQKEHDSLTQAHNSLEELNSSWAQQNTDHIDLIQNLRLEVDNLKTQMEDSLQCKAKELEKCREEHVKEIMSLQEQLTKVCRERKDCLTSIERWEETYLNLETDSENLKTKIKELEQQAKRSQVVNVLTQTDPMLNPVVTEVSGPYDASSGLVMPESERIDEDILDSSRAPSLLEDRRSDCETREEQACSEGRSIGATLQKEGMSTISKLEQSNAKKGLHDKTFAADGTNQSQCLVTEDYEDEGRGQYSESLTSDDERNKPENNNESSLKERENVCANNELEGDFKCVIIPASRAREPKLEVGVIKDVLSAGPKTASQETRAGTNTTGIIKTPQKKPTSKEPKSLVGVIKDVQPTEKTATITAQGSKDETNTTIILKTPQKKLSSKEKQLSPNYAAVDQDSPSRNNAGKRVRFSLELSKSREGDLISTKHTINSLPGLEEGKTVAEQADVLELFSDEEADEVLGSGVSQQISQIEAKLKSDRLRTNRKRKYSPIV